MNVLLGRCETYLLRQPPSVKLLVLSDLYQLPRLRSACVQYAKDTSLSRLRQQEEFDQIELETLVEILTDKVERFEPLHDLWKPAVEALRTKLDSEAPISQKCGKPYPLVHELGKTKGCSKCKEYNSALIENPSKQPQQPKEVNCEGIVIEHKSGQIYSCSNCQVAIFREMKQNVTKICPGSGRY